MSVNDASYTGFIGGAYVGSGSKEWIVLNCYNAQTNTVIGSGLTDQIPVVTYGFGMIGFESTGATITDPNTVSLFWDTETSGVDIDDYATGHITSWMQTKSNYEAAGWNFDTIWFMTVPTNSETFYVQEIDSTEFAAMELCVYADGNSIGTFTTDANGAMDLGAEYSVVIAGFNYFSKLETLPLVIPGGSRISDKKVMAIDMDLYKTTYMEYAMGENATVSIADFEDVISSVVTFKRLTFPFGSMRKPTIFIRSDEPVPLGIRGIYSEVSFYEPR